MRSRRSGRAALIAGSGPLAKVPPIAVFAVVLGLFVAGILIRGVIGAALLGVLALGVAGLLAGTWRALTPSARAGRLIILTALLVVAISIALTK
jgi:hypothetical protein